eukprot:TRINITY_DN4369_c0_g2_i2.p1 TRINITY_DN4369_c0_g2~~TRINITY_DN4369_c0_g2_i2.p1  ORF type:complete len:542 (+),score=51.92 TRINITY_DN4369_c0_g2_i2:41-1666(+)
MQLYVGSNLFGVAHNVAFVLKEVQFDVLHQAIVDSFESIADTARPVGAVRVPFVVEDLKVLDDRSGVWQGVTLSNLVEGRQLWVFQPPSPWHSDLSISLPSPVPCISDDCWANLRRCFFTASEGSSVAPADKLAFMLDVNIDKMLGTCVGYLQWENTVLDNPLIKCALLNARLCPQMPTPCRLLSSSVVSVERNESQPPSSIVTWMRLPSVVHATAEPPAVARGHSRSPIPLRTPLQVEGASIVKTPQSMPPRSPTVPAQRSCSPITELIPTPVLSVSPPISASVQLSPLPMFEASASPVLSRRSSSVSKSLSQPVSRYCSRSPLREISIPVFESSPSLPSSALETQILIQSSCEHRHHVRTPEPPVQCDDPAVAPSLPSASPQEPGDDVAVSKSVALLPLSKVHRTCSPVQEAEQTSLVLVPDSYQTPEKVRCKEIKASQCTMKYERVNPTPAVEEETIPRAPQYDGSLERTLLQIQHTRHENLGVLNEMRVHHVVERREAGGGQECEEDVNAILKEARERRKLECAALDVMDRRCNRLS